MTDVKIGRDVCKDIELVKVQTCLRDAQFMQEVIRDIRFPVVHVFDGKTSSYDKAHAYYQMVKKFGKAYTWFNVTVYMAPSYKFLLLESVPEKRNDPTDDLQLFRGGFIFSQSKDAKSVIIMNTFIAEEMLREDQLLNYYSPKKDMINQNKYQFGPGWPTP